MILDSNFALRREDVETHFRCLDFITSVESHRQIPILDPSTSHQLNVDLQMQCCLKAQTLILLYNMVESTTCECLNFIYDTVADEGLLYSDLTDKMRRMWTSSYKRAGREEHKWGEGLKMPLKAEFVGIATNTSGNIDIRKIYDIFNDHGCVIAETKREEYGRSFLTVKNKRNLLAHGNVSFSQCGSTFLFSDLDKMRRDITDFLMIVIETTKLFVHNKEYKRGPE